MRRYALLLAVIASIAGNAHAESELVIAILYLHAQGTSHSHLYLYREDGKLLRQLTNDNSGQDSGLNHIRYAREKSAALCYGMSMYRPGLTPTVITSRRSSE